MDVLNGRVCCCQIDSALRVRVWDVELNFEIVKPIGTKVGDLGRFGGLSGDEVLLLECIQNQRVLGKDQDSKTSVSWQSNGVQLDPIWVFEK